MAASVDIITLDNFQSKMPKWDPTASNHLFALVDMGSNGIRFSISDLSPPRARLLKSVYKERAAISLFDALNSSSDGSSGALVFPAETITRVSQTLARFRSIAVEHYGVPEQNITVFATEAMRRSQNALSMLEAIRDEAGLNVQILTPAVETLFGAVGARSGFADVKGLFLDLGGGSVQMTYMDTYGARQEAPISDDGELAKGYEIAAARSGQSLPFGAARLIRVLNDADLEVRASETSKLQIGMREAFENLRRTFESLAATVSQIQNGEDGAGLDVYLCGGGFRGYGSMLMHCDAVQPYPIPSIGSYTVPGEFFCRTRDMVNVNQTYDGKIFGMSKRRRAQFPAIVTVVEALISAVPKIRRVTFCSGGNREGALMMRFPKEIRESDPATSLVDPEGHGDDDITQAILSVLLAALPTSVPPPIFDTGLGPLFVRQVWHNMGHDSEANASAALHDSLSRDSGSPGLTHFGRALLALMLCARWGGGLGPFDQQLRRNLHALLDVVDADVVFWAEYIGAVAATVATIVPSYPKTADTLRSRIKFESSVDDGGKTTKLTLTLTVTSEATKGIDLADLEALFKNVGKTKNNGDKRWKVNVQIQQVSIL